MSIRKSLLATAVASLLGLSTSVFAGADGRTTGVTCTGCHGFDGESQGAAPSLKGMPGDYIADAMKQFKSGEMDSTIMGRIAKGYSDDEIDAMANYYANIK